MVRREKKWKKKKKEKMWEDGGGIAEALFLCLDSGKGKCTDEEKEEENGVCIVVRVVGLVWFWWLVDEMSLI